MDYFVDKKSIVREIWGKGDTILFIFAGASAEFALNKAVDWLYYTGRLPKDPLGRLFSTVSYAREIVFSEKQSALKAIDHISSIHTSVENKRGKSIPDWAYRDVLFMLIGYSIMSFEILERKLNPSEKEEVFNVFWRVGKRMNLKNLPQNFKEFEKMRQEHLEQNLQYGEYTRDLYKQYRKHLGPLRYHLLLETQKLITPRKVRDYLNLRRFSLLSPIIPAYKISRSIKIDGFLKSLILPSEYKAEIRSLDRTSP
ncbi:DUF2236 domain-containing protein [Salegentibacter sp. JZCK2]|uniref:oxygenase MpaB family protein n=1 Tax=Salegentibacter tibetensis TaxID=2873600 RepID=UPI001CCD2ABC|nr:oxygenase MpaB family protein [Salegentibacter tibetensis]MBZ9730173.1 DUF2236 domain-containing protein [Salegentibacter tibetensis]